MGTPTLVVRHGDLTAMADAMRTAQDDLRRIVDDARRQADSTMSGWTDRSESRAAQRVYDARIGAEHHKLLEGLEKARTTLVGVQEDAASTEARCVAILD